MKRAKQKQSVQSTVYGDTFKMKDVVQLVMDDEVGGNDADGATGGASFIKQKRSRGNPGKKKDGTPLKTAGQSGKQTGKKSGGKKAKKEDEGAAQALFDEIDREEGNDEEESDEDGPGVTFKMDEFEDAGAPPTKSRAGGKKQGDDDDQMVDDY